MKLLQRSIFYSFVSFLLISSTGCKQDFDVTAEYKEIPVVYGLLNPQETTHYIRIQKGYLIDGNARVAAGVADSVYYSDSLIVKLIPHLNGAPSGGEFVLQKVNGDLIGLPKQTGTFANSPNILYTFTGTLNQTREYRLEVRNLSNGNVFGSKKNEDSLNIKLIKDFQVITPSKAAKLNLTNNPPARVIWNTAENAGVYDLKLRFWYKEFQQSDNTFLRDTFAEIVLLKSFSREYSSANRVQVDLSANLILSSLANRIPVDPNVYREFNIQKGMQFIIYTGGIELDRYLIAAQAQGGLVSNEALPAYTNIDNGVGLLSSRYYKQVDSVLLSNVGLDSLACSSISRALKFKNSNGQICN